MLRSLTLLVLTLVACSDVAMTRRLDALATSSRDVCDDARADTKLPPQKQKAACSRALACAQPVAKALHDLHDAEVAEAELRDSSEERLVAAASYAAAQAACATARIRPNYHRTASGSVATVPAAPASVVIPSPAH